ncbi:MAG: Segregation and condensation protein A [Candidatus Omnitrophica bacterium]|nr:Segregation and condensation protein A [Candidatus Omnitrophota bacterium]
MSYKIKLEVFEGPLDLLLYLIKKDELDIYNIPITRITEQYLEYIGMLEMLDLDVAGEFLVMAATLMHIKSRMLLPPDPNAPLEEEADPRAELVRRLIEYKAYKEAAERLKGYEDRRGDLFVRGGVEPPQLEGTDEFKEVTLFDLMGALGKILKSLPKEAAHEVVKDEYTVHDKIEELTRLLENRPVLRFSALFKAARNKYEVITTFLAILELARLKEIGVRQDRGFGEIEVYRTAHPRVAGEA